METLPVDPVRALFEASRAREAEDSGQATELGRDDFLRLLIAKLENQDPMSPGDDTEFVQQLATFSSLEQLISVNESLEFLALGQGNLLNAQALDLIGKEALVESDNQLSITGGVPDKLVYVLVPEATSAELRVLGEDGTVVRTLELDADASGRISLNWDGKDEDGESLPDGDYTISYSATDAGGEPAAMAVFRSLSIDGVNFLDGGISLISGDREIPFASIVEFRAGS